MRIKVNVYSDVSSNSGEKEGRKWSFNKQDCEFVTDAGSRNINFTLNHDKVENVLTAGVYNFDLKPYVNKWSDLSFALVNPVKVADLVK